MQKTLFLTSGMLHERKLWRLYKAILDTNVRNIHVVGEVDDDDSEEATKCLCDLIQCDNRQWNTIKLNSCGHRMEIFLRSIINSNLKRLIISPSPGFQFTSIIG